MSEKPFVLQHLNSNHDRSDFSCGEEALDRYLQQLAGQDMRRGASIVIVATPDNSRTVLGFYTLSTSSFNLSDLPEAMRNKFPRHKKIPAILLGRLAVDQRVRGKGLGKFLYADAVNRACGLDVGWLLFIVQAKNNGVVDFYRKYGFNGVEDDPLMLWITRKSAFDTIVP